MPTARPALAAVLTCAAVLLSPVHADPPANAQWPAAGAVGVHGMALVGAGGRLYVSHLPMFHAPHDAQVVLEVEIAAPAEAARLAAELSATTQLWTIEPERFDLDALAPGRANPISGFRAHIYAGHFERGGVRRYSDVDVRIREVIHYRKLQAGDALPAVIAYVPLGSNADRQLAFKPIAGRGDVDHIVAIEGCRYSTGARLEVRRPSNHEPMDWNRAVSTALRTVCDTARVSTLYFETGDLK